MQYAAENKPQAFNMGPTWSSIWQHFTDWIKHLCLVESPLGIFKPDLRSPLAN